MPAGYIEISPEFSYAQLRVGLVVRRSDGREVYCQPGDDSDAMRETIDALEEIPFGGKRNAVAAMVLGDYFEA